MKPRNLAVVKASAIAKGAPNSNGRVALDAREQAKLDENVQSSLNAQAKGAPNSNGLVALDAREQAKLDEIVQSSLNAQANLQKATQDMEQQGGRLVGALEATLDRKGLNPADYKWAWDGRHITISPIK